MTHHRIAAEPVPRGADIDSISYVSQWECDGCGMITLDGQDFTRIQGQVYGKGVQNGYLNADLCGDCMLHRPVKEIIRGL